MKYNLFCRRDSIKYIQMCIRSNIIIETIFLWAFEYDQTFNYSNDINYNYNTFSINDVDNFDNKKKLYIAAGMREWRQLVSHGIEKQRIILFYIYKQNFLRSLKVFDLRKRILFDIVNKPRYQFAKLRIEKKIMNNFAKILKNSNRKFAIIGLSGYSRYFANLVNNYSNFTGIYAIENGKNISGYPYQIKPISSLLYEDTSQIDFYLMHLNYSRKMEDYLLELGVNMNNIYSLGDMRNNATSGAMPLDIYDQKLGYTRIINNLPGYILFQSNTKNDKNDHFRIMILGGSTSDPTTANVKSWSECLYNKLNDMGIEFEIYSGGISAYTSEQELEKLLRDGLILKPNLVLSYSGINNSQKLYNLENHPLVRKYQADLLISLNEKGLLNNFLQQGVKINGITFGLAQNSTSAQQWVQSEQLMHGICKEFNIPFHGFLQPYNKLGDHINHDNELKEIRKFYVETLKLIEPIAYLHDFTKIFDGKNDIFFDLSHVYEKGNQIIAKKMMPIVLDEYEKWRTRKNENTGDFRIIS